MALLPEHAAHHSLSPSEIGLSAEKKAVMNVDIARTTNHTGEQIHMSCPVYEDDSREALRKRMNFCYSVIQDRLEAENEAINWRNKREAVIRRTQESVKRNQEKLKLELKKLEKSAKQQKWDEEAITSKKEAILSELRPIEDLHQKVFEQAKAEIDAGTELTLVEGLTKEQWQETLEG